MHWPRTGPTAHSWSHHGLRGARATLFRGLLFFFLVPFALRRLVTFFTTRPRSGLARNAPALPLRPFWPGHVPLGLGPQRGGPRARVVCASGSWRSFGFRGR